MQVFLKMLYLISYLKDMVVVGERVAVKSSLNEKTALPRPLRCRKYFGTLEEPVWLHSSGQ